jgi:CMP/dCMP kinase
MINIAIDGPAGAGKSTVAKLVAKNLNILYLDTGAMYRSVAYYILNKNVSPDDTLLVEKLLNEIDMDIKYVNGEQNIYVNGENITPYIRENAISMAASTVSKIPKVRIKLVSIQRQIASKTDCVLDGRDIGSYVLPDANLKIYLTASPEVRAKRRYEELKKKNKEEPYEKLLKEICERDYQDMNRDFATLVVAKDAISVDTSDLTIQEVSDKILALCKF